MDMARVVKRCLARFRINGSIVLTLIRECSGKYAEQAIKVCPDITTDENGQKLEVSFQEHAARLGRTHLVELLGSFDTPICVE
jgi:hypothetical protein